LRKRKFASKSTTRETCLEQGRAPIPPRNLCGSRKKSGTRGGSRWRRPKGAGAELSPPAAELREKVRGGHFRAVVSRTVDDGGLKGECAEEQRPARQYSGDAISTGPGGGVYFTRASIFGGIRGIYCGRDDLIGVSRPNNGSSNSREFSSKDVGGEGVRLRGGVSKREIFAGRISRRTFADEGAPRRAGAEERALRARQVGGQCSLPAFFYQASRAWFARSGLG